MCQNSTWWADAVYLCAQTELQFRHFRGKWSLSCGSNESGMCQKPWLYSCLNVWVWANECLRVSKKWWEKKQNCYHMHKWTAQVSVNAMEDRDMLKKAWSKQKDPAFRKQPCVFLLYYIDIICVAENVSPCLLWFIPWLPTLCQAPVQTLTGHSPEPLSTTFLVKKWSLNIYHIEIVKVLPFFLFLSNQKI
jgi:hypothetical protein